MLIESHSAEETYEFGRLTGSAAKAGEVYLLSGDLGAGKTVFAKGFAAGLGVTEPVTSPTFTILQVYEGGRLPFYHFDVYRIEDSDEMEEIGCDEYFYGSGVCLIEWADRISDIVPPDAVSIEILKDYGGDPNYRRIRITRGGSGEEVSQ